MDNGHSFDEVLFYGSESLLLQFELMLFTVIIGFSGSFLSATVAVGFVYQVRMTLLDPFKYSLTQFPFPHQLLKFVIGKAAKYNLGRKTLIDNRFLI